MLLSFSVEIDYTFRLKVIFHAEVLYPHLCYLVLDQIMFNKTMFGDRYDLI